MTSQSGADLELDRLRAELIDFVLRETASRLASDDLLWKQLFNRLNEPDVADHIVASPAFSALADRVAARVVAGLAGGRPPQRAQQQPALATGAPAANAEDDDNVDPELAKAALPGADARAAGLFSGLSGRAWLVMGAILLMVAAASAAAGWGLANARAPAAPLAPTKVQ